MQEFEPKKRNKILTKEFLAKNAYVLVLAVLLLGGIAYGYTFFIQNRKIASGSLTTAPLNITLSNAAINATGLTVPTDNQEGLSEFVKQLTITNNNTTDGIVKLTLDRTSGLNLTDMSYALVVNGSIQTIDDVPSDGVILETAILGNEVIDVELRLWPKTSYTGSITTFVGEIEEEIKYLGEKASNRTDLSNAYVNFNCNGSTCEVWRIVKVETGRLVLTRDADLEGASERVDSGVYNSSLSFNDDSMITSVSTDNKNVYLAKTVKINGGNGTQTSPYTLINNINREPDKKVIATITYKNGDDTVGTQFIYYNETNYISQELNDSGFQGWTDGTNDYQLGDVINFNTNTILNAKVSEKLQNKIMTLCNDNSVSYVQKYDTQTDGQVIDTPDGSGNEDVCYYRSTDSSNLAGQNGNVIFGDYCWQIVRTTTDGGVKLVYNGLKTNDDKCPNDNTQRPSSIGAVGNNGIQRTTMSGNKIYGTSFEIIDDNGTNKFKLKHTFTANWNGDYDNDGKTDYPKIIGNFVCGTSSTPTGTSDTCEVMYYVGQFQSSTQARTTKYTIGTNNHFSQIGSSSFSAYSGDLSSVGYMYSDTYKFLNSTSYFSENVLTNLSMSSSSYYYGDKATWNPSTNMYDLTINDNGTDITPTVTTAWNNIRSNAQGMYTCLSTTDTSCATVYYIVANSTSSWVSSVPLENNENINTKTVTWMIGTGYEENNGVYSLTGTSSLTILLKDWYTNYSNSQYKNYYICDNLTSSTCTSEVYYVGNTSTYQILYNKISNTYFYANDVEYINGEYKLILDDNDKPYQSVWEWFIKYNTINNTHYTCLDNYNSSTNSCGGSIYYIYYTTYNYPCYIELENGDKIEDALQKMLNTTNSSTSTINKYNSAIKGVIDSWYESNLSSLSSYLDNDAVFCNDRSIISINGWSTTGNTTLPLYFKKSNLNDLSCSNITDRFSKNNSIATLTNSIGLLNKKEADLMNKYYLGGSDFWYLSHSQFRDGFAYGTTGNGFGVTNKFADRVSYIRPAIVLASSVEMTGYGTYDEPYIIKTTNN